MRPWRGRRGCHSWCHWAVGAWAGADHRGTWSSGRPGLWGTCSHPRAPPGSGHRNQTGPRNTNSWWECDQSLVCLTSSTWVKCHSTLLSLALMHTGKSLIHWQMSPLKLCIKSLKAVSGYSWYWGLRGTDSSDSDSLWSPSDGPPCSLAQCTLEQLYKSVQVSLSSLSLRARAPCWLCLSSQCSDSGQSLLQHQRRRPEARLDQSELGIAGRTALSRRFPPLRARNSPQSAFRV